MRFCRSMEMSVGRVIVGMIGWERLVVESCGYWGNRKSCRSKKWRCATSRKNAAWSEPVR